jgi:hypothetical protein
MVILSPKIGLKRLESYLDENKKTNQEPSRKSSKDAPRFMGFDQICMVAPPERCTERLDTPLTLFQGDGHSPRVGKGATMVKKV